MATSTSSAMSTTNQYIKYKIEITEKSTSTSNNTSSVQVKVRFYRTNTGYTTYGSGTVYCTIDGTRYTASVDSSQKITEDGIYLFSKTLDIAHNSDGSKSLTVSAYISHSQFSSDSQSYTVTLTTIARASSITSAGSVTLGNAVSIKFTPASSSFYYKIKFAVGSYSTTTSAFCPGTTSAYTYTGYTMSTSTWAPYITSATTGTCTATLYTYSDSGSTQVGSSSSATFTVTVPSSVVPSVSFSTSEGNSTISSSSITGYVSGKSKIKVSVTATMSYSSAISSISVTVGSSTYSPSLTTTSTGATATATSGTISATSVTVKVTATDKRGRTASSSQTISLTSYTAPTINTFTATRCENDGTESSSGEYIKIVYKYTVTNVSGNTSAMTIKWKKSTASSYSNTLISESGTFSKSSTTYKSTSTFSVESAFNFQMTLTDALGSATKTLQVSTAQVVMDIKADGTGLGIGKVAESSNTLDIAWLTKISYGGNTQLSVSCPEGDYNAFMETIGMNGKSICYGVNSSGVGGVWDRTLQAWILDVNSTNNIYLANSNVFAGCYIGHTEKPLYLRGSSISIDNASAGTSSSESTQFLRVINKYNSMQLRADGSNYRAGLYSDQSGYWLTYYDVDGNYNCFGHASLSTYLRGLTITVQGDVSCNSDVSVEGNINLEGTLYVGGRIYCENSVVFENNHGVRGTMTDNTTTMRILCFTSNDRTQLGNQDYDSILYGKNVYLNSTSTAVTSDRKLKSDITTLSNNYDNLLEKLTPRAYTVNNHSNETHIGFVVDEVESAMKEAGLDPDNYGLTEHFIDDETGEELGAIRYEEIIPMLVYEIQELKSKINILESEIE